MFPPRGRSRGFPRQPGPWWDGPRPRPPPRPEDSWDEPSWDKDTWDGPPWDGPPRDGPPRDRPPRDGPPRDRPPRDGPPRDRPPRDGPPRDGPPRDGPPWDGPPRDGPPWDGPPWDGPPRDGPPWEHQHRRCQPRRCPPSPRAPRPFPGPGDIPWKEEEHRWAPQDCPLPPQDCPLPPPWDDRDFRGYEGGFGDGWHQPSPRAPRPFPGPGDIPWKEEEHRWAPQDCPPPPQDGPLPPPWDDRDFRGYEDGFGDCWYQDPLPDPWPEFPQEEQPPPWPRNPGAFPGHRPPERRSLRKSHIRHLTQVPLALCPRPPRGHKPHSKPSPALSKRSQPEARKEPEPPQPPAPPAERPEPPQDGPVGGGKALEPPGLAGSPQDSPAAEPPVELGAGQTPVGSQDQDPCALGADPAPPEETANNPEIQEHLEVEPCSAGVPKAGTGHGSHPQSPAAPPEPAQRELLESNCSGEAGAELSPRSWEQPPPGAGEAEAGAAQDGSLQSLQPPKNPQDPPGSAAEPEAQPSQASPGACSPAETSPGSQRPPGPGETNPAVSGLHQLCSLLPTPFLAGIDLRSAAVLAKKEQIEQSYQQFSLTVAVVATMLLQKEPSMEAVLGLALRANLRQRRLHHLQELRDFIDAIDSAIASL